MKQMLCAALLALPGLCAAPALANPSAPYAGQQDRAIAALSDEDVAGLLDGAGMGFAKPAELTGYPGPAHVLELADDLALTPSQKARISAIHDDMRVIARELGAAYIEAEAALQGAFEKGDLDYMALRDLTGRAERVRADLRSAHLAAHLETRPVLNPHQIMIYNRLRGYDTAEGAGHGQHHQH